MPRLIALAALLGLAISLCSCEEPQTKEVHHYHTTTVVKERPQPREFEVVNQYDEQAR
jgi:hypothetical protein